MPLRRRCLRVFVSWCLLLTAAHAEDTDKGHAFFERKIRPQLIQHCYRCHSAGAKSIQGGLLLDTKAGAQSGGDSGAAVVPGDLEESLLIRALRYEDLEMPPKGPLSQEVIEDFETWIAMGAPDPRESDSVVRREIDIDAGRDYWAFQPLLAVDVPETKHPWPRSEVDRFLWSRMQQEALHPIEDAEPAAWLRRVTFDLTGLPPHPKVLRAFLADEHESARERIVDELLSSAQFGEQWGRHWLDLARYAESTGRTRNYPFPAAWRYRDYVIEALSTDKPYDQFLVEQLAGDLLPASDEAHRQQQLMATGFLAVGSPDLNERNAKVFQMDTVADQIDTISRAVLGLTVGCARCHDHKFDPIPTKDYYALAGIFTSSERLNGYTTRRGGNSSLRADLLISLDPDAPPSPELTAEEELVLGLDSKTARKLKKAKRNADAAKARVAALKRRKNPTAAERKQLAAARKTSNKKNQQFNQLRNRFQRNRKIPLTGPVCMGIRDNKRIADCRIHIRGDTSKLGEAVPRGFLQVMDDGKGSRLPEHQSGRLELARWITDPDNPLTSRVFVNRVWHQLFGQGLVRTVDNFGAMGAAPSHPQLLDYLAREFILDGWSTKRLIRKLVLSRTYGLEVNYDARNAALDANNRFLWRMKARRLNYEAMRDALLVSSGELVTTPPTGSIVQSLPTNELSRQKLKLPASQHRSVYLPVLRNLLPPEAAAFDFPDASETRGARDVTTVPTQSLYFMNSEFVIERARCTAALLLSQGESDAAVAKLAYERLFSRRASEQEVVRLNHYVHEASTRTKDRGRAWAEAIHAMFASAEFRYR